jgi:hypothetical protein
MGAANPEGEFQQKPTRTSSVCFLCARLALKWNLAQFGHIKNPAKSGVGFCCGERGIRTPGPVTVNGFQDRRIRPLCHLSFLKGMQN